ncbi:MAG: NAD-dependent epimerase/dehydratase family protein [Candidatus Diapherotrites archaeon]|nr:NAD-dependent epimerase/dehydratase family protein [Candidatus Diapherotrites archaeon]
MKILVTGSSGMIGREVTRLLRQKNIEVVEYSRENGFDILDAEKLAQQTARCDAVIRLAAELDEHAPRERLWKTNVDGTQNVLDACAKNRVQRLLFTSSVGVYGNTTGIKTEETPLSPQTEYEKSKAEAEKRVYASQELVPYTILRPALVIGPNAYWKQIMDAVKQNMPLFGPSTNRWQTVYYKDLANAIVFFLFLDTAENETILVASDEKPPLRELVETIRSQLGMKNPAPTVSPWFGKLLAKLTGIWMALRGKPNLFSDEHITRMMREREYDLTKLHAYGWKAKYGYAQALKETLAELQNKTP